jgi:hypothetical protein
MADYEEIKPLYAAVGTTQDALEKMVWLEVRHRHGWLQVRRIVLPLAAPTRSGDTELILMTNLPEIVQANQIYQSYRGQWQIDIYHAYNLLKIDLTVQEARDPISRCVKTAIAAGLPLWFEPARADGIGSSLSAP